MNKILAVVSSLASLAVVCSPAYANPKRITLDCSSGASTDVMTGDAKVTLCSEAVCSGQTATCSAPITCDSSGANGDPSPTVSCSASFKVVGVSYILTWYDYSSIGNPINNGTNSGSNTLNNGKVGFSTYDQYGSDSVTLTVK